MVLIYKRMWTTNNKASNHFNLKTLKMQITMPKYTNILKLVFTTESPLQRVEETKISFIVVVIWEER